MLRKSGSARGHNSSWWPMRHLHGDERHTCGWKGKILEDGRILDTRLPYKNYSPKWHYQGSFDRNGLLRSLFSENFEGRKSVGRSAIELEHWIKGSLSSSWMNSPIPSLLLPLWQNESLCKTIGMKMSPVRSFAWKSSHFHAKRLAQALVLKKQTATQKWK